MRGSDICHIVTLPELRFECFRTTLFSLHRCTLDRRIEVSRERETTRRYSRGRIRPCSRRCRRRRRRRHHRRRRRLSSSFSALASSLPMFSTIPNPNQSRNPHSDRACTAATEVWQRCRALASVSVLASYSGGLRPSLPRLCLPARG